MPCCRQWLHSEMWWPRLFRHHGAIAWDDYEKDYSDLPRRAKIHTLTLAPHACELPMVASDTHARMLDCL